MQGLVTVFGGSGFIGAQVTRALAKQGYRVRVAVRRPGLGYRLPLMGDVGQIELVQANLRNPASIGRALDGAEGCINLVGVLYETGRQGFADLHAKGAEAIASACAERGIQRMVQVSAIGADAQSASKYARTKAEGEAAVRAAMPGAVILRPSMVFGPEDHFFNKIAQMAVLAPVMPVLGAETRVQPVLVADVARAAATVLADPAAAGRTFELGGPSTYTMQDITQITLDVIGRPRPLLPLSGGAADALGMGGDVLAWLRGPLPMLPPPPITTDQLALLKTDNVVADGAAGLADLGIAPAALEPIIPTYLYRYRKGGQYADLAPPEALRA